LFLSQTATCAKKPQVDIPVGIFVAVALITLTYVVPLITSISVLTRDQWADDLFAYAAKALWEPMFYVVNIAALFGLLGLGVTFLSTSSEAIAHSCRWGYMPKIAQKRTKKGKSPWFPITIQGVDSFLCHKYNKYLSR